MGFLLGGLTVVAWLIRGACNPMQPSFTGIVNLLDLTVPRTTWYISGGEGGGIVEIRSGMGTMD